MSTDAAALGFEVLAVADWFPHSRTIEGQGGIVGQLTKCRAGALVFYVRENFDRRGGMNFYASSAERWGWKTGNLAKRFPQILELCATADRWEEAAALVRAADIKKGRPVAANRNFTAAWAEREIARKGTR